jgi:hypothetical protein
MTHKKFDEAVKAFASGTDRRTMMKVLAGGVGAAAITAVGLRQEVSADALKPRGGKCNKPEQCASGCCKGGTCRRPKRCA